MQSEELTRFAIRVIDSEIDDPKCSSSSSGTMDEGTAAVEIIDPRYITDAFATTTPVNSLRTLVSYFKTFDPVNAVGNFDKWFYYVPPSRVAMETANNFLTSLDIGRELLQTTERDHLVHAIFSFLLYWTDLGLMKFKLRYPKFGRLASMIALEKKRVPVYVSTAGVPFLRSGFKLLTQYVNPVERQEVEQRNGVDRPLTFDISNYVSSELVEHFEEVYRGLLTESMTTADL